MFFMVWIYVAIFVLKSKKQVNYRKMMSSEARDHWFKSNINYHKVKKNCGAAEYP